MSDGKLIFDTQIDDSGFKKDASSLEQTGAKMSVIGKKIAKGLAVGAAAAGAATVAIGKQALEMYADYEQLTGGIETLFGKAYDKVMNDANNAFRTCGMSANQYMEQVTSFSASLKQSLGGDTVKAAEKANIAMTDMADNANKMGTDMERITDAYQGFAKQNYTMLDNLKLGYGGTKTEMERLLKDAQAISGVEYNIDSYADVVDAIHVIQTQMGITGTTAKEATETISGSVNMAKAAWANLLTGLADGNADLDGLIRNFADSIGTVMKNIAPVIKQLAKSIPAALNSLLPELTGMIVSMTPELIGAIMTLINGLIGQLPTLISQITAALPQALNTLISALPELIQSIIEAITQSLPMLLQVITAAVNIIAQNINQIVTAIVEASYAATPQIIMAIIQALPGLVLAIVKALISLAASFVTVGPHMAKGLWKGIKAAFGGVIKNIKASGKRLKNALVSGIGNLAHAGREWIGGLWNGIKSKLSSVISSAKAKAKQIPSAVKKGLGSLYGAGKNLIDGLWRGIKGKFGDMLGKVKGLVGKLPKSVKKVLGIASPSKVMMAIGRYFVDGFTEGINDRELSVTRKVKSLANNAVTAFRPTSPVVSPFRSGAGSINTTSTVSQTINFNQPVETPAQTARVLRNYSRYGLAAQRA